MASISFDTHKFIRRLQQAGVSEAQAEAIVDAFREAYGEAELATKQDLRALEMKLEARFEALKGEMTLIKWMLGLLLGGVLALILKALFPG
ncbi:coiled-coil domain-containing protein [Pelomicrobium sp. G1]|uniref:coiled-coil domain-containing protein n=1 Tax=unclassified Pelomicrobium TaxID=2815318 RepID=UPI003F7751EE